MNTLEIVNQYLSQETARFKSSIINEINKLISKSNQRAEAFCAREQEECKIIEEIVPSLSKIVPGDNLLSLGDNLLAALQEMRIQSRDLEDKLLQKEIEYRITCDRVRELKDKLHEGEDQKEEFTHDLDDPELPCVLQLMKGRRVQTCG